MGSWRWCMATAVKGIIGALPAACCPKSARDGAYGYDDQMVIGAARRPNLNPWCRWGMSSRSTSRCES
ncbi:MAG: hypothetical protein H6668_08410 [Ardenticatenaceae bacterium]|nr:hypothetical protein [Ardenticatenaceae bacterium]